ncbi:TBC1 domain family member 30 isoform X2 [Lepisosteus oculatus]|uniref:TBC1 domain family member 30 isoform X2 n=1 Tax=Lepisosteus oculatus TaxID=7918 RepID=UPI00371EF2B8
MASPVQLGRSELLEIDICAGRGSGGEDGGSPPADGFSAFQRWVPARRKTVRESSQRGENEGFPAEQNGTPATRPSPTQPRNGEVRDAAEPTWTGPWPDRELERAGPARVPRTSIVDCLLVELYDTYSGSGGKSADSVDSSTEASSSDAFLGRSNTGSNFLLELQEKHTRRHQMKYLAQKDTEELKWIVQEVNYRIGIQSAKLVRQLRRKDRLYHKLQKNSDIVTACLQAVSQKRRVDTRLKFTLEPSLGKNGFQQWYDALKAVARLPTGIPKEWRKRVWLTLADQYLHSISIDWEKTLRFAFNDRSNPDDDSLGIQIVKDLHRTGCSSYCGQEAEQDRVVLKRVLLAYARWNKAVGYCQGFNVLAALILEVVEGNEGDALKVMIYLIDKVLPDSYFANNLRALLVDMAVFRDLLRLKLPELSQHLDNLQKAANREVGGSYEPPLTNVFTMQWFLTMFATCLPHHTVLKIWDSVFFEGSEVLLRAALAIWARLGERIESCQSADEFYSTMGCLTQEMLEHNLVDSNELMQTVYSMAAFPFPQLAELREKYTYNITPFPAPVKTSSGKLGRGRDSDEEIDIDDEDALVSAIGCLGPLSGLLAPELQSYQKQLKDHKGEQSLRSCGNIAELSPGAVDASRSDYQATFNSMMMERMTTDISALKKQYIRIKRRQQQQASLVYIKPDKGPATSLLPSQIPQSPVMNHLLLGKKLKPSERGCRNAIVHVPGSGSPPTPQEDLRAKLNSPWRTHVRVHRKNVARAKGQLGYGDALGLIEGRGPTAEGEPGETSLKNEEEEEEEEEERRAEQKVDGQSPEPVFRDPKAKAELQEVLQQLSSLGLEPGGPGSPEQEDPPPCRRKTSDSSSSDSGGSVKRTPLASSAAPAPPAFCPFPSVKPPRKSAAARNLGLYGPTSRTPTVHFPQLSKSVNRAANGAAGPKIR